MTDKTIPVFHLPPRERAQFDPAREYRAPRAYTEQTPPSGWHLDRTVPIIWIAVVVSLAIGSSAFAWAWEQNASSAARQQQMQDIQVQLQQINQSLYQMNARLDQIQARQADSE